MLLKDWIVIDAPASAVWEYVGSPDLWSLFYSNVRECRLESPQGRRIGSVYTGMAQMGTRTSPARWEIVDFQPGRMIQVYATVTHDEVDHSAILTFMLDELGAKTRVRVTAEIKLPRVNVFWRALIWLISRFGQPVGENTLGTLKEIVEDEWADVAVGQHELASFHHRSSRD